MITIEDFSFRYDGGSRPALEHIDLTISDGDFVGVTGGSGAGKSTLTYALNGIVPHHYAGDFYGSIHVNGLDTVDTLPEKLSSCVGSVFQDIDGHIVTSLVEDELTFGLENFGVPDGEIESRVSESLQAVGIPKLRQRAIRTLSGGQKQKVAIAAVLALRPDILVLDEPTGELDPASSRQVFEVLRGLNRRGMTIVVVEQKIMLLCEFVKNLVVLDKGRIVCRGGVAEVMKNSGILKDTGVHVPRIVSLSEELAARGLYRGAPPVDLPEAEQMVRGVIA